MNSQKGLLQSESRNSLHLSGIFQKIAILCWGLITIISMISLTYSIYSLNLWDRLPAAELPSYFTDITPESAEFITEWKNTILQRGLSLSGYALIFTLARAIAGISLFIVGFMLIRRYSHYLLAVLMAILLSVFAATGIWNNSLFGWGVAIAPWLTYPVQLLGWLGWCGLLVVYTFPDGKLFVPRWMLWLAILLIPLTFFMAFNIDTFLNPENWAEPFYLLPTLIFTGGSFLAVLCRYKKAKEVKQRHAMRFYVWGVLLLIVLHFANLLMNDVYYLVTGVSLFQTNVALLNYVLLYEPAWFASETLFAIGLALSVFRDKLIETVE